MTQARSTLVPDDGEGVFHCISRCVRRAWLCGEDPYTGNDYSHRKQWVRDRLEELAGIFAVEVYAYAVMSNHLHVVLRISPDTARQWSDRQVVERWRQLHPWERDADGKAIKPTAEQMKTWLADEDKIELWRERLGSLSWMMGSVNESLARRANKEDKCKGRFWEGRFKSQLLCDAGAVMSCMAYVDLNVVRAGLAKSPEESDFTSILERFEAERSTRCQPAKVAKTTTTSEAKAEAPLHVGAGKWLTKIEDVVADREFGPWGVSLEEYLNLVDETGRMIVAGKRGVIPPGLEPILIRLELEPTHWLKTVEDYGGLFQRMVGKGSLLIKAAKSAGVHWFCGKAAAGVVYRSEPMRKCVVGSDSSMASVMASGLKTDK